MANWPVRGTEPWDDLLKAYLDENTAPMSGGKVPDANLPTRLSTSSLTAAIAAGVSAVNSIAYDTDFVPYLTDYAGAPGAPIAFDTDGAPYLSIGA